MKKNIAILFSVLAAILLLTSCGRSAEVINPNTREIDGHSFIERAETKYADGFTIDRYDGDYSVIYTADGAYLIVPAGHYEEYDGLTVIERPADNIYLASTSVMTFFDALEKTDAIGFSSIKEDGWYFDSAVKAMQNGDIVFAGKYSEPDYELLLTEGCTLSIQSTMINHTPEVKEKLEELGITVFTDYSSYETHPLGRCEWIKVYAEMLGMAGEAERLFNEQSNYISTEFENTGKTAVFFHINSSGQPVVRKASDYMVRMIEIAGGTYIFDKLTDDKNTSTLIMEWEEFYQKAKEADFIIYNTTMGGALASVDDLAKKKDVLGDFKAVKEGNVWITDGRLYQATMQLGEVIADFNAVFTGSEKDTTFLHKLEGGENSE